MMARIAIIGIGAIGARHLQALARVEHVLEVDVVDPSEAARNRAAALLADVGGLQGGKVNYRADISGMRCPDLAIVATNARERPRVIVDLLEIGARSFMLEKVLFTKMQDYDRIEYLLAKNGASAWVNCVRRAYPRAGDLVEMIDGRSFHYRVEGKGWGLGCNLIHHLDEFVMLSGNKQITLDGNGLAAEMPPAKRPEYIEFNGTLLGTVDGGSRFAASCMVGDPGDRVVTITCDGFGARLSQINQTLQIWDRTGVREEPFPIPLQSEATAGHVVSLLRGKEPALPDFETAAGVHRSMLQTFLDHLRRTSGDSSIDECPIT